MAGHSHWKQIKEHKGDADKKRGVLFSKLVKAISAAAKTEPNPQFNPRLRTAIETARENSVPQENIERAIKKASSDEIILEEMFMEAYAPGGIALLIKAITDNTNRTVQETKAILKEFGGKWAEPGSVRWAFNEDGSSEPTPKFPQNIPESDKNTIQSLINALLEHEDIQNVYHNAIL